jgi:hypothetical protein
MHSSAWWILPKLPVSILFCFLFLYKCTFSHALGWVSWVFYQCYFHTHPFGRIIVNMKQLEVRIIVLGIWANIFLNNYLSYTTRPNYSVCSTCITFASSYNRLDVTSNAVHAMKTMSWLTTILMVLWTAWKANKSGVMYLVRLWMIGMHPTFVTYRLSGSLLGSSSQMKKFYFLIRYSMTRLRWL